ncbi:MAG: hypothetical protein IJ343_11160 [Clostridia bacterium]|nr:hypothetical protein [Clostridia bacterium]
MGHFHLAIARAKFGVVEKHADDPDVWSMFIIGKGTAAILERDPATGKLQHRSDMTLAVLHEQHRSKPELRIDQRLHAALLSEFLTTSSPTYLRNALELLLLHLHAEGQGTAPFRLDCTQLMDALATNVRRNLQQYIDQELLETLQYYDNCFQDMLGVSFLCANPPEE